MKRFHLELSKTEIYTAQAGLALVGQAVNKFTDLVKQARSVPKRHGIPNIELFRTFTGLLCLGKSDFEAVENARHDPFFRAALGIKQMPSSARLRQRFDEDATALIPLLEAASVTFLSRSEAPGRVSHPANRPRVPCHDVIVRQQAQPFGFSVSDENSIKRVAVNRRQVSNSQRITRADRKLQVAILCKAAPQ